MSPQGLPPIFQLTGTLYIVKTASGRISGIHFAAYPAGIKWKLVEVIFSDPGIFLGSGSGLSED